MTIARYAGSAAIVWMLQMVAAVHAYAWSAMPSGQTSPPAPVRLRTGEGIPLRWLVVGVVAGLCVLLLGYAALLAMRTRIGNRTSDPQG